MPDQKLNRTHRSLFSWGAKKTHFSSLFRAACFKVVTVSIFFSRFLIFIADLKRKEIKNKVKENLAVVKTFLDLFLVVLINIK